MYLSAKTTQFFQRPDLFGCMFSYRKTGGQDAALKAGCKWMLDNGAFTNNFNFRQWVDFLATMLPYRQNCIGIIVPDVPYSAAATIERFMRYRAVPEALGYKTALATQDGMTPESAPWPLFDVLFIGGSDTHKRGPEAEILAKEAKRRGKRVHVGRVSSAQAIAKYWTWADSFDGTTFCFDGGHNPVSAKMARFVPALANHGQAKQWRLI
jgi:hypothetical protein